MRLLERIMSIISPTRTGVAYCPVRCKELVRVPLRELYDFYMTIGSRCDVWELKFLKRKHWFYTEYGIPLKCFPAIQTMRVATSDYLLVKGRPYTGWYVAYSDGEAVLWLGNLKRPQFLVIGYNRETWEDRVRRVASVQGR